MKAIEKTLESLSIVFIAALVSVVLIQIIGRIFDHPFLWTEELARHCLVYSTFLGGALAFYKGEGLRITALIDRFPSKLRKINDIVIDIICLFTAIIVLYFGANFVLSMWSDPTPAMRIPKGLILLSVPIGFFLIIIKIVKNILSHFKHSGNEIKEG